MAGAALPMIGKGYAGIDACDEGHPDNKPSQKRVVNGILMNASERGNEGRVFHVERCATKAVFAYGHGWHAPRPRAAQGAHPATRTPRSTPLPKSSQSDCVEYTSARSRYPHRRGTRCSMEADCPRRSRGNEEEARSSLAAIRLRRSPVA